MSEHHEIMTELRRIRESVEAIAKRPANWTNNQVARELAELTGNLSKRPIALQVDGRVIKRAAKPDDDDTVR